MKYIILISLFFTLLLWSSCGRRELTPEEKLIGEWEIENVNDRQKDFMNPYFEIKKSTIQFFDDGTLKTFTQGRKKEETGTWRFTNDKNYLYIIADSVQFKDSLRFVFENERKFVITNQNKKFIFKKV